MNYKFKYINKLMNGFGINKRYVSHVSESYLYVCYCSVEEKSNCVPKLCAQ